MRRPFAFGGAVATLLGLAGAFAAPGCEQIAAFPDRVEGSHVAACVDSVCACVEGFDDCDGDLRTNGCEVNLASAKEHCSVCERSCRGGECEDATCKFFVAKEAGLIAGPLIFGDRVFYVDRLTGDLLASSLEGDADFQIIRSQPEPQEHLANLFLGADGLYVVLTAGGPTHFLRVSADGEVTEPFGVMPWGHHSDLGIVVTSEALFYQDGTEIRRVDRATLERTVVTLDARNSSLGARGEDVFFAEGQSIFVIHPVASGGGSNELLFADTSKNICRIIPLSSGFVMKRCAVHGVERWDEAGNVIGATEEADTFATDGGVLDVVVRGDVFYYLDDDVNELRAWDGTTNTWLVTGSQPFNFGSFRMALDGSVLYWGSKSGVVRLAL